MVEFFDYFQLCALGILCIVLIGNTFRLSRSGIRAWVIGSGKKGFRAILEKSFFLFIPVWSFEIVIASLNSTSHIFPRAAYEPFIYAPYLKAAGVLLITAGYVLFTWSLVSIGDSWRIGVDSKNPGSLVTGGAFAVSRNPVFVFLDSLLLGIFLMNMNPFFLIATIIGMLGNHLQILQEEKFLIEKYGDEYVQYRESVRRYL